MTYMQECETAAPMIECVWLALNHEGQEVRLLKYQYQGLAQLHVQNGEA